MLFGGGLFGFVLLALWIWSIVDVITTPDGAQRNLPKVAWVFVVLLFWILGAMAWIVLGRPRGAEVGVPGRFGASNRFGREDARDEAGSLSERERREIERREYYRRMDDELDRRLEERRRQDGDEPEAPAS